MPPAPGLIVRIAARSSCGPEKSVSVERVERPLQRSALGLQVLLLFGGCGELLELAQPLEVAL